MKSRWMSRFERRTGVGRGAVNDFIAGIVLDSCVAARDGISLDGPGAQAPSRKLANRTMRRICPPKPIELTVDNTQAEPACATWPPCNLKPPGDCGQLTRTCCRG